MNKIRYIVVILLSFSLFACKSGLPSDIVSVDNLFQMSKENVKFPIADDNSVDQVILWISEDTPTSAELLCVDKMAFFCRKISDYLQQEGIPYESSNGDDSISLNYERVDARKCISGLGCAVSQNIVYMISDHKQLLNPALSGMQDASDAVASYRNIYSSAK